jgi:VanZ family protein
LNPYAKIRFVLLVYVLLVVLVSLVPSSGFSFWHIDKIGHFFAYGGMAILALLGFDANSARFVALVGAVGLGALLEWGQSFVPGRDMSLIDGVVNALGVLVGAMFFRSRGHILLNFVSTKSGEDRHSDSSH